MAKAKATDKKSYIVTAGDDKGQTMIGNQLKKVGDIVELNDMDAAYLVGRTIALASDEDLKTPAGNDRKIADGATAPTVEEREVINGAGTNQPEPTKKGGK